MPRPSLQEGGGNTPRRKFSLPTPDWEVFLSNTEAAGSTASATLQAFVHWYNRVPGARLPKPPRD